MASPRVLLTLALLASATLGGARRATAQSAAPQPSLKAAADARGFLIGSTVRDLRFKDTWDPYSVVLAREFNYITIFSNMGGVETERGKFNFKVRDAEVAWAREHGLKILGHPLIWDQLENHRDVPAWLNFGRPDCGGWSKAELDQIMKEWIQTYVSHFKGVINNWVVVNEPLKRSPGPQANPDERFLVPGPYTPADLSDHCWTRILGESYIEKAFAYAHEADPDALLILNDQFGLLGTDRIQQDKFLELVRRLKARGVPIHAVGHQMHLNAARRYRDTIKRIQVGIPPSYLENFRDFLKKAQALDVQVHVTEMDVYLPPEQNSPQKLKDIYKSVLSTCLQFANCTAATIFGVTDKFGELRTAHPDAAPLLFDDNYQAKPAYFGVLEALAARPTPP